MSEQKISPTADFRGANYEPNVTVTKAELLQRLSERATPDPHQHLKPRNIDHAMLDYERERRNERRIEHLDKRLHVARVGMRRDHLRAAPNGHTKAQFNAKSLASERSETRSHERERER